MELTIGGLIWRILFVVVAILAVLLSRRPTYAQRATEALGVVAVFGVLWSLAFFDLQIMTPFLVAAAIAFGLLSAAEARH
jgi:tryptophan-rich sensory protein